MMRKISYELVEQLLESAYKAALYGVPGSLSAEELAEDCLRKTHSRSKAVDDLINWQIAKCVHQPFIVN